MTKEQEMAILGLMAEHDINDWRDLDIIGEQLDRILERTITDMELISLMDIRRKENALMGKIMGTA
jgi:hypothetical protein